MDTPFFFTDQQFDLSAELDLSDDTSKHIISVLRMKVGDEIKITNGMGEICNAEIVATTKKICRVSLKDLQKFPKNRKQTIIAISLLKNPGRWEWFLEKSAELGIDKIVPLLCDRTERQFFRKERMNNILVSAMLQSKQYWITTLDEPLSVDQFLLNYGVHHNIFIAHCEGDSKTELSSVLNKSMDHAIVMIGPEGDFTKDEIEKSVMEGFREVALGSNRLRTETAGVATAVLLKQLVG